MRVPTENQHHLLRILASGAIALAPHRREWNPLLRRGWVEPISEDDGSRFLPPLRITSAGLRALADAVDRYGMPEPGKRHEQLNESPVVTRLKAELADVRGQLVQAERDLHYERVTIRRVRAALGER